MIGPVVTLVGVALLVLGVVSRRPGGRWWSGGGSLAEQFATLVAPAGGVCITAVGVGVWVGDDSAATPVLGAVALLGLVALVWTVLSLPVPDRFLVPGSSIRQDRARRRERRRRRRGRGTS